VPLLPAVEARTRRTPLGAGRRIAACCCSAGCPRSQGDGSSRNGAGAWVQGAVPGQVSGLARVPVGRVDPWCRWWGRVVRLQKDTLRLLVLRLRVRGHLLPQRRGYCTVRWWRRISDVSSRRCPRGSCWVPPLVRYGSGRARARLGLLAVRYGWGCWGRWSRKRRVSEVRVLCCPHPVRKARSRVGCHESCRNCLGVQRGKRVLACPLLVRDRSHLGCVTIPLQVRDVPGPVNGVDSERVEWEAVARGRRRRGDAPLPLGFVLLHGDGGPHRWRWFLALRGSSWYGFVRHTDGVVR
jgi:hypothetical protein